jgi:hypothetical protein
MERIASIGMWGNRNFVRWQFVATTNEQPLPVNDVNSERPPYMRPARQQTSGQRNKKRNAAGMQSGTAPAVRQRSSGGRARNAMPPNSAANGVTASGIPERGMSQSRSDSSAIRSNPSADQRESAEYQRSFPPKQRVTPPIASNTDQSRVTPRQTSATPRQGRGELGELGRFRVGQGHASPNPGGTQEGTGRKSRVTPSNRDAGGRTDVGTGERLPRRDAAATDADSRHAGVGRRAGDGQGETARYAPASRPTRPVTVGIAPATLKIATGSCVVCGKKLENPTAKTCSNAHRQLLYRQTKNRKLSEKAAAKATKR